MTTEAGGGVPLELRERLTNRVRQYRYDGSETAWDMADAILAEIAAAGYELVESERMERIVHAARDGVLCINHRDGPTMIPYQAVHLKPGDLDRGEGE